MELFSLVFFAIFCFAIGRASTSFWRTDEQNFREEYIDYWARQREAPTFDVSYDWKLNQRQTRYNADAKAKCGVK